MSDPTTRPEWSDPLAAAPPPPLPVVPLEYVSPRPRPTRPSSDTPRRRAIGAVRQIVLAAGLALFAYGLGESILRRDTGGPPAMTVGAFLFALALPLRRGDRFWS